MNNHSLTGLGGNFYLVQTAAFLNAVGARCGQFAIAWWVLGKTGDPVMFSTFVAIATLADVLSRAAFGWLGDQHDRHRLLVLCYTTSSVVTVLLAGLSFLDMYLPVLISLCLAISGIAIGIRDPVQMSLTPALVPTERVGDAVRLRSIVGSSSSLMGPLAAGILLGPLGVLGTLTVNALAVAVALILITQVKALPSTHIPKADHTSYITTWYRRTHQGFCALYRVKPEWNLSLLALIVNFSLYPLFAVLFPVLINSYFPQDLWLIAVTEGSFAVGLLIGSFYIVKSANRLWGRPKVVFSGFLLVGVSMLACGIATHLSHADPFWFAVITVPLLFAGGAGLVMVTINTSTVRMLATPDNYRNRVGSATSFISGMVIPFGALVGGTLSGLLGVSYAIALLGLLIIIAAIPCMFNAVLIRVLAMNDEQIKDAYRRFYPEAFPD
jgi:MFS family permease